LVEMMAVRLAMGTWLLVLMAVAPARPAAPRHAAVLPDGGGSGDGEEVSAVPPILRVTPVTGPTVAGDAAGTTVTNSSAPGGMLDGLVAFFKEYMLLAVVVGSLAFVLLFIICAAVIVRQKHKASAYYPSSFPKKKYVDQRDKTGGARAFTEVPEKVPDPGAEEPLNSSLQADILAAAQNLKPPPPKAPLANGARGEQKPPAEEEEEEGSKKLGDEPSAEPPPQNPGAE
ncbi:TM119 protein, partial [Nyctibius grandis]|nr:TM119 protein [Nyctibius grandis]